MTAFAIWLLAFAVYLLFAGTVSFNELVTGLLLAGAASLWAYVIRRVSSVRFAASRDGARHFLRALTTIPLALARTAFVFAKVIAKRGEPGRSHANPFVQGAASAGERTRRAAAVLCASLTPDRFVVAIHREHDAAFVHDIVGHDRELDHRWLQ
jgi:multisubunit Na+/H+ antiporter MnhE subunit